MNFKNERNSLLMTEKKNFTDLINQRENLALVDNQFRRRTSMVLGHCQFLADTTNRMSDDHISERLTVTKHCVNAILT